MHRTCQFAAAGALSRLRGVYLIVSSVTRRALASKRQKLWHAFLPNICSHRLDHLSGFPRAELAVMASGIDRSLTTSVV
jgi:hypothetical protein